MSEIITRNFLTVTIAEDFETIDGDDEFELDDKDLERLEATPRDGHYGASWNVGAECSANYIVIYEGELEAYIELLTEMKRIRDEDRETWFPATVKAEAKAKERKEAYEAKKAAEAAEKE